MNLRRFIGKIRACWNILRSKAYPSFSQAGEDQIVRYLFTSLNISRPTFLDIGTNDPIIGNNTYSLYLRGSRGVCVEPDNRLCDKIKRVRPEDILLRMGVGLEANGEADLYVFPDKYHSWNTFSKNDADKKVYESGIKVLKIDKVPLITINEIVNLYFSETPDFLSIDIEGLDLSILKSLDFKRYRPKVICVECVEFSTDHRGGKNKELVDFLLTKGYFIFGDTYINTIFCDTASFKSNQ